MTEELKKLLDDIYEHALQCTLKVVVASVDLDIILTKTIAAVTLVPRLEHAQEKLEEAMAELTQIRFHIEDYGEEADSVSDEYGGTVPDGDGVGE